MIEYLNGLAFQRLYFTCPHLNEEVEASGENISFEGHQGCIIVAEVKCVCEEGEHYIRLGCW